VPYHCDKNKKKLVSKDKQWPVVLKIVLKIYIDRHLALIFYYFFLYTVFVCKFRPQESQSDVLGDLRRMICLVVGLYIEHASSARAGT
jgi:hypothetical protein